MGTLSYLEYRIGIICALPIELAAVAAILDNEHPSECGVETGKGDGNTYTLGQIHQHNVVIVCLPAGIIGTSAATAAAGDMARTFRNIRLFLMVGIGGGIPSLPKEDIRLGDVVISQPQGIWPGVVQYDMGKRLTDGVFERTGSLDKPPVSLLTALSSLQAQHCRSDSRVPLYMKDAIRNNPGLAKNGYSFPGADNDCLHCAHCSASQCGRLKWLLFCWLFLWSLRTWWPCTACKNGLVLRRRRQTNDAHFHYGTIASANSLIKDATTRDRLREEFNAKCVEMEAAGLMNNFPCIVIRGICDYADAYKNDDWQKYAALSAAAFAKEFLFYVVPTRVNEERTLGEVMGR